MSDKYVINPSTGRSVKLGGKAYRTLIKEGKIKICHLKNKRQGQRKQ